MEKKQANVINRISSAQGPVVSAIPSDHAVGIGNSRATFAGAVRRLAGQFDIPVSSRPLVPRAPSAPSAVSFPPPPPQHDNLPTLPPFLSEQEDLLAIECAQRAAVIGPFKRCESGITNPSQNVLQPV